MDFINELEWRGLIQDKTPELDEVSREGMISAYIGFDPTAPSLHIGNLVTIMLLVHLQRAGHRPVVLVGGATGRIGDPSGKDAERALLDLETIQKNVDHQTQQLKKFLNFDSGENKAVLVNNYDFYKDMNALEFLRDVGKYITVNYMMSKDSVKNRLESGLSFTEFSYQLIQGYDFKCLHDQENCILQMGGSDQWGNITTGVEIIRKMKGEKAHALTTPLLLKPDGKKYGKSEGGNVWLDPNLTSPYKFYQFFLNSDDSMVSRLLRTFTLLTEEEIQALEKSNAEEPHLRLAHKKIAEELTARVHSKEALSSAIEASKLLFGKAKKDTLLSLSEADLNMVADEIECFKLTADSLKDGINILDVLVDKTTILNSNGEGRRAIKNQAIAVNKDKVKSHEASITSNDLLHGKYIMLENGKKNKYLLVFS